MDTQVAPPEDAKCLISRVLHASIPGHARGEGLPGSAGLPHRAHDSVVGSIAGGLEGYSTKASDGGIWCLRQNALRRIGGATLRCRLRDLLRRREANCSMRASDMKANCPATWTSPNRAIRRRSSRPRETWRSTTILRPANRPARLRAAMRQRSLSMTNNTTRPVGIGVSNSNRLSREELILV